MRRAGFKGIFGIFFIARVFFEAAGVADEEVVFIDEVDEVVGGSFRKNGGDGAIAVEGSGGAIPFLVTVAAVVGVEEVGAGDFGAVVFEDEGGGVSAELVARDGGNLFFVREGTFVVRVEVGVAGLHLSEGGGELFVEGGRFFRMGGGEVFLLLDVDSFGGSVFCFVEAEEFEFFTRRGVVADELVVAATDRAFEGDTVGEVPDHGVTGLSGSGLHEGGIGGVALEKRGEVEAIEWFTLGHWGSGERENGGVEVEAVDHDIGFDACLDPGAGDDERDAGAAFHDGDFSAIEREVFGDDLAGVAFHPAIVGGENEVGVFDEFVSGPAGVVSRFEFLNELADVVVEHLDHGAIPGVLLAFLFPLMGV